MPVTNKGFLPTGSRGCCASQGDRGVEADTGVVADAEDAREEPLVTMLDSSGREADDPALVLATASFAALSLSSSRYARFEVEYEDGEGEREGKERGAERFASRMLYTSANLSIENVQSLARKRGGRTCILAVPVLSTR